MHTDENEEYTFSFIMELLDKSLLSSDGENSEEKSDEQSDAVEENVSDKEDNKPQEEGEKQA